MNHANAMPDIAEDEAPSDQLAEIAMPFRTPAGVLFAEVMQDGHSEIWPINGDKFAELIQRLQRKETGQIFPKKDLTRFIDTLKAEAQFGDVVEDVHLRVARAADRIYIDLCDPDWRVIEIDATGWRILEHSPIRFRRTAGMLPLPDPVPSGSLDALWDFLRIDDPGERLLVIAHLLGTLAGVQPFPLLYLFGSQGTAKTTATEILGSLVDPRVSGVRSMPKSERDLFLAAQHGHLLTFDNVSTITHSMSDALCRLATGATFATRKNYSDADEVYLSACNPIICNGIGHSFVRPDLADRTITVTLSKVPDDERQPHAAVMRAFEAARPSLLGALCAALSTGLGRQNSIAQSTPLPRMADFALWGIACEPAYARRASAVARSEAAVRKASRAASAAARLAPSAGSRATVSLVFDGLRNRIAVAVAPTIEALANAFVALASDGGILRSAIDTLIGNLGRLASYAATFAAVMAGRWVAGLAAAALSVRGLATALVFLRGALIRTGIGALIVGAGELVYQFSQLVARVGGVGEAFRLLGDLAREVWSRIGLSLDAALARMAAGWEGLKAAGLSALEGTIAGVVSFGDRTAAMFQGAYDAAVAIWGSLPGAIGDFAFQAANGLISGVEAMLNGVVTRINNFIETLNVALALLPEWATGEGGVRIGILDPVELGRIGNPFEGAATAAGAAAADAFSAALSRTYLEPPDLGLGAIADDARARADGYREAAGMLADAAGRPLASWQALKDAVTGTGTEAETALADAAASADALTAGLNDTATAADGAGGAARDAGAAAAEGADTALTGWQAVTAALADYAAKARDIGGDIGQALVGAFTSAENAIGDFVKSGKLDFRDLVTSMIADLAKLAARRFILGPIANALSGALSGAGGIFANILHAGGVVGASGPGRMVPALAFAGAPRMHNGGWAGLRPDEVPAILQRGERVLSRREAAGYGQASVWTVNVTINARDAESFRQSRTQVASDIARAVSLGRRGM